MRRALFLALAALIALPLAGCPLGDPDTDVCLTHDPDGGVVILEAGDSTGVVRITNCGTGSLTLREIRAYGAAELVADALPPLPARLPAGASWPINVRLPLPRAKGLFGTVEIVTDEVPDEYDGMPGAYVAYVYGRPDR